MDARFAEHGRDVEPRTGLAADRKSSPVVFTLDRLFPKRGKAPYATAERLVVLVKPRGPHQRTRCCGCVHASQTNARGAWKTREMTISWSALLSSPCSLGDGVELGAGD